MVRSKYYVTTPIYYPNDVPHLGHAYTTIAADVVARWHRLIGKEVFFLTGTDDHGKKIAQAAEKAGKNPKEFTDELIPEFKKAWKLLNIKYDRFIRTTDKDHEEVVKHIIIQCEKNGDIYKSEYEGFYCTSCEAYYTEKDAPENVCPIHRKQLEILKEESYFFRLSKYQKFLLELYEKNPDFISPENRRQEVINRVKEGLKDFSISRTSFNWGIPFPLDKRHVTYVWFDALINYISGVGYLENKKLFNKFWPADVHLIGKDILWFHTVYWPAMLKSAGIPLPKKVFAHGWWTVLNQKMGKSAGNAVKIDYLISIAGVDSARYFLLRSTPFGEEGDFSEKALIERHNNELANKLGNLVSRVSSLGERYGLKKKIKFSIDSSETKKRVTKYIENFEFDKALSEIFRLIDSINEFVQEKKIWETKNPQDLYEAANGIKDVAILLYPFIPETSEKISKVFNFEITKKSLDEPLAESKIKKSEVLFEKVDFSLSENKFDEKRNPEKEILKTKVDYSDFEKLDLRVGKILEVNDHPNADKLYILKVDFGEGNARTIVAGLKKGYSKESLLNKKAVFVTNLKPVNLRGVESDGMILAAVSEDKSKVFFITPEKDIKEGTKIS